MCKHKIEGEGFLRGFVEPDGQVYLGYLGDCQADPQRPEPLLFLIPVAIALISVGILFSQILARYTFKARRQDEEHEAAATEDSARTGAFRRVVDKNGGAIIFLWMVARVLGSIVLVGASISAVLASLSDDERWLYKLWSPFTNEKNPYELLLIANTYALVLATGAIVSTNYWRDWLIRHNIAILLTELAIYVYRDAWPLATFDKEPLDLAEGWPLWVKLGALTFTAVIVPLCIPTIRIPLDPKNPGKAHPEQTASILSSNTYSYLTPTISAANKIAHLPADQFPDIADYDRAHVLSARAFPHLDPLRVRKGRHIFWGLLRLFAFDYFSAIIAMTTYSLFQFASPIAINRLLTMLESGTTQTSMVRPWFWILCLLISPLGTSVAFQSYILTMTRALVRTESVLTQLIFDYSLRVRVKAESSESGSAPTTRTTTPDAEAERVGHDSRDATLVDVSESGSMEAAETDSQAGQSTSKAKDKSPEPPKKKGSASFIGKLNNLVTVDLNNVTNARDLVLLFYCLPIQLIGCSVFLYVILGWSAFVGLATMVALLPVPGYMTKLMSDVQSEKMKKTDSRTQTVTESMNVLRMIKMFGWEQKIQQRISERREEELTWIWKLKLLELFIQVVTFTIPTITMLVTYATATLVMKMELKAATVFSSMILFDTMRNELQRSNYMLSAFIRGKVSLDRFNAFFKETELLDLYEAANNAPVDLIPEVHESEAIGFRNASFTWNPEAKDGTLTPSSQFKLTVPGELEFAKGKINMIIGATGSGKTSLLMALLGEMHFTPSHPDSSFNLPRAGGVSFAVQESWVQNETIRENILFHSAYDEGRYKTVLHQCALEQDLEMFEAGDQTEVGERGLTLSGGQKARLTLARAIYSKSEIILLDDVLAALDVHTSSWIVKKCLQGDLVKGRTVLLVTHNIALASPIADFIVTVSPDGVVTSRGHDIKAALLSEPELQAEFKQGELEIADEVELIDKPSEKDKQAAGKLIVAEEIQEGNVSWKAIKTFLNSLGGDRFYLFFALWIGGCTFEYAMHSFNLWFLGLWSSQYELYPTKDIPVVMYMATYAALTLLMIMGYMARDIWWVLGTMRASRTLHRMISESVLGTTLRWLDETPISRIITRMTQDINAIDGSLMQMTEALASLVLVMFVDLISAVLFVPMFTIPGIFIAIIGIYMGSYYLTAQLSVKREMSNAKAPMLAHFGAAMAGLVSIRAYGAQRTFINESEKRVDHYVKIARLSYDLNRWINIRIDFLGAVFTASLAAYLTYMSTISAANVGFSLNRAVEFTSVILYVVRVFNMFQVEANSLERIVAYTEIEQEPKPTESGKPPASWPTSGDIKVENLTARYSKNGPAVLHGLTFDLRSGERVGVVGRTGSGKSSLTLAMLRCILTDGSVRFDGLETDKINLDALRSNITIIPQLPELLSGSLRYNLDPFDEHDDATLNAALRSSGLYASHNEAGEGRLNLDSNIASGGANVSVGQRQIIALARAIVRSSKLLILDEATSAIDHETDGIIQNTLRRELGSDVTVLTIAHRLQTIIDADRVMVLDAGRIVEFGSPAQLLAQAKGVFKALVDDSGDKKHLYEVAAKARTDSSS